MEKKSHKGLWTFLIILFVIIAFVLGFFVSKIILDSKKDEPKKEENLTKEIAVESEKVKLSLKSIEKLSIPEGKLYQNDKFDIDNITDEELLVTALNQLPFELVGYCGDFLYKGPVSLETINKYLNDVVMDKQITFDLIKKLATHYDEYHKVYETRIDELFYVGLKNDDIYVGNNMCEGEIPPEIVRSKVSKAEELDDTLYVYEKRAFYDASFVTKTVKYYSDVALKNLVETKKATIIDSFMSSSIVQSEDLNWDSYNTYKYTFKLKNGHYYFKSFEIVK